MNDLLPLLQIVATMAMLVAPPILLTRLLAGSGPVDLADLFQARRDPPRPAGVQEEDQPAFRFDRSPRDRRPITFTPNPRAAAGVPAPCADERAA